MKKQRYLLILLNTTFNMVLGFILPVNTIFINKNLNKPLVTAGLVLMIYSATMMIGNTVGGVIFDKLSKNFTLLIGYLISTIALFALSLFNYWPIFPVLLSILGFGMGISYTGINGYTAYIAQQSISNSRIIFNNMYLAANLGIAVGSTAVGFIFKTSIFLTFFIPAIIFLASLFIVIIGKSILDVSVEYVPNSNINYERSDTNPKIIIGKNRFFLDLIIISMAVFIVWVGYSQWDSNLSVYMLSKGLSTRDYGLVFTVNAGSLLIVQPLVNKFFSKLFNLIKYQLLLGISIMSVSFLFLPSATKFYEFIFSMLILTIGESMVFPAIPALLNKLSTDRNRGTMQSIYSIFGSLGRAIGPYVGSMIITLSSFSSLFIFITIIMFLSGLFMIWIKEIDNNS